MSSNSLTRTLLIWLGSCTFVGIAIAAGMTYLQARAQANELFDYQMKQMVASLPVHTFSPFGESRELNDNHGEDIVIQMWDDHGLRIYHSHEHTSLPQRAELGFTNVEARGNTWRVYSAQMGNTVVQVAQPLSARHALAANMALRTIAPLLILLPALGILAWLVITRSLRSVTRVATELRDRNLDLLSPLQAADVPSEIRPLTDAFNGLLQRLAASLTVQRNFVADAAHELKTPLTALTLQLQLAQRAQTETDRMSAFADLKRGLERSSHLVNQLLTLARQEPGTTEQAHKPVDLAEICRQVKADLSAAALSKLSCIELIMADQCIVIGDVDSLHTLVENLLDNAIRYSPAQSSILIAIERNRETLTLRVRDNGNGVPEEDLSRLCDRFYRVPGTKEGGSGLGLAIVQQIAQSHSASLHIHNLHPGLEICVDFPAETFSRA